MEFKDTKLLLQDEDYLLLESGDEILLEWDTYDKIFLYKIYGSNGTFISTWSDVVSQLNIKYEINGGIAPLTLRLARPEDAYGENEDVKQGNLLKIYVFDKESGITGQCIYSGILVSYIPIVDGSKEYVDVVFYSHYWDLSNKILESSGDTEVAYSSQDPSDILKDLFNKYTAINGTVLDYNTTSIQTTGTSVSYTFNTDTYQNALNRVIELCPDGWFYRIEPDDIIYLEAKEVTPTHSFTIGKDITSYQPEKKYDGIVNTVYFRGGDTGGGVYLFKKYTNSSSVSTYGTRAVSLVDQRVTQAATAQIMADRVLDKNGSPEIRVVIKLMDSNKSFILGYDIESLKVGQTCKILNATSKGYNLWDETSWDTDSWDYDISNAAGQQLQIMSVEFHLDFVILELSNRQPEVSKRIEDINRNLTNTQTSDNPTTPS